MSVPERLRPDEAFEEPWQARAFALALLTVERLGLPWDAFRARLADAITKDPRRPYFESWLAALDGLLADHELSDGALTGRGSGVDRAELP